MKKYFNLLLVLLGLCYASSAYSYSQLSDNIRIESKTLGYSLQYRVYTPTGMKKTDKLPTIYLADGQWYLSSGDMAKVLDDEISSGRIKPVIAIFVDNRNPDNLEENRRNKQFFCNEKYVSFYKDELLPNIKNRQAMLAISAIPPNIIIKEEIGSLP